MDRLSWCRGLCVALCMLGLGSSCTAWWGELEPACEDPTKASVLQASSLFGRFAQDRVVGCLRVTWGSGEDDGVGVLVRLDKAGTLTGYDAVTQKDRELRIVVPREARSWEREFEVFLFGDGAQESQWAALCKDMGKPSYRCKEPDGQGKCWFSIQFAPRGDDTLKARGVGGQSCRLNLPAVASEAGSEASTDAGSSEPQADDGGTLREVPQPQKLQSKWAKSPKGSNTFGAGVALDSEGNVLVVGHFFQLDPGDGIAALGSQGSSDVFVAKLSKDGTWLWAKSAGSRSDDRGYGVAVDGEDNVFITGFHGPRATFGGTSLPGFGIFDVFVAKLNKDGTWLWAKSLGSAESDSGQAITVDAAGDVHVAGEYNKSAFFACKYSASGQLLWQRNTTTTVTRAFSKIQGIAVNSKGEVYVAGTLLDPMTFGAITLAPRQPLLELGFVAQLDASGKWVRAEPMLPKENVSTVDGIAVDQRDQLHVAGTFAKSITFGDAELAAPTSKKIFVARRSPSGEWLWARQSKGEGAHAVGGLDVDAEGNIAVSGSFSSAATFGELKAAAGGLPNVELFAALLDNSGAWTAIETSRCSSQDCVSRPQGLSLRDKRFASIGFLDSGKELSLGGISVTPSATLRAFFIWSGAIEPR